ncbi:protein ANTHESIS POMOTING FACTOR 1-like [Morus notabilis]|uniref:protein ANTHESIS POMOTING FACTOR 1-like n=1 Tax=Morus notabilis TaxID=981085 RepID=UPI000CECEF8D|nr:protein ANTHESIS POMOTING FACTOR 1-like [Morus notabilis]
MEEEALLVGGEINSIDFHRKDDILVTASEDDSVRLYDIANAKLLKTTNHKKHGADRICFIHHPSSVICSSRYNLDSSGESLLYLSMYDNRCLRYFKVHRDRINRSIRGTRNELVAIFWCIFHI